MSLHRGPRALSLSGKTPPACQVTSGAGLSRGTTRMEPQGCLSHRAQHWICRGTCWSCLETNTQPVSHHEHTQHLHGRGPRSGRTGNTHTWACTQLHTDGYTQARRGRTHTHTPLCVNRHTHSDPHGGALLGACTCCLSPFPHRAQSAHSERSHGTCSFPQVDMHPGTPPQEHTNAAAHV